MALFSMKLENLQQLFLKELRDLYDAEKQITDALPKMIDAAKLSGTQERPATAPRRYQTANFTLGSSFPNVE